MESFLLNGEQYPIGDYERIFQAFHPSVYEVVRVMDGTPLFLEEHFERLTRSLASIGEENPLSLESLRAQMDALASENHVANGNVRLVVNGFSEDKAPNVYLRFVPATYPSEEMYRDGVQTALFSAMRDNPQAKIVNQSLRNQTDAAIREQGVFEVLLVDAEGHITEGSRSNVFFIKAGRVYTCPAHGVLLGVTRQRILRLCHENAIPVEEATISADHLESYEAAFISGTSPKVLPIANVGEVAMNRDNPTLCRIMALYDAEIDQYLQAHKK